jgi:3-oxoadipate enol-lactonase/3-oxoadipate enol-lactonase/4-carboxymuconolactone decarboxylase
MAEIEVNGARTHYDEDGRGEPVVLVHGLGGTGVDIWKHVIAPLAAEFRVISYDLRGSGRSEVTEGPYAVELLADDLGALLDALELGRVALMGHSLGGGIVLRYAATHPERVRAVVGVGAVVEPPEPAKAGLQARAEAVEAGGMAAVAETVATNGLAPSFREANPEEFQEFVSLLAANDPAGYAAQCRALVAMALTPLLERVEAPALLVCGEVDQASPPAANRENAARLRDARLVEIPDCAHIIPWEKPEQLLAAALPFLREHV